MTGRRYILTLLAGKAVMVAMMAIFGQSLTNALENPLYLVPAVALWVGMYFASKPLLPQAQPGLIPQRTAKGPRRLHTPARAFLFLWVFL